MKFQGYNLERVCTRHRGYRWFAFVGLSPIPALNGWDFPSVRTLKAAIKYLSENDYKQKAWNQVWIFAVNPNNYSECYGKLTPKRLALRNQYLKDE